MHLSNDSAVSKEESGLLGARALGVSGDGLKHTEDGGLALGLHSPAEGLTTEAGALRGVVTELGEATLLERTNASGAVLGCPFTGCAHITHTAGLHAAA